jgi:SHS2 domain-containing protein
MATAIRRRIKSNGFSLLAHPSDIGLRVKAKSLRTLFARAAAGVVYLILGPAVYFKPRKFRRKIVVRGLDREQLLVKWLNEIIFFLTEKGQLAEKSDISYLDDKKLVAELSGRYLSPENIFLREIKSATYQGLNIVRRTANFRARIIFDV